MAMKENSSLKYNLDDTLLNLEDKKFEFLEDIFLKRKSIQKYALDNSNKDHIRYLEQPKGKYNFVISNNKTYTLEKKHWNKIYDMLLQVNREEVEDKKDIAPKLNNKEIKQENLRKIYSYKLKDKILYDIIHENLQKIMKEDTTKMNTEDKHIKILTKNASLLARSIESCIVNSLINKLHKSKFELEHIQLGLTNISSQIGDVMFQAYIKSYKKLNNFLKNPQKDKVFLKSFLKELNINNYSYIKETYKNIFDIAPEDLKATKVLDNLSNFIFEQLLKDIYKENMLINDNDIVLNDIIDKRKNIHIRVQAELTKFKVKLGERIIRRLIEQNVFTQKSIPSKNGKKFQYVLEIENSLTFKVLLNQSSYKPYLIPANRKLKASSISLEESNSIDIEGARYKSFIHTNRNVESYTQSDIKELSFPNKFCIDIFFLNIFLESVSLFVNKKYSSDDILSESLFDFLTLFGFSFKDLYETAKVHREDTVILKLINFCLDFNVDIDKEMKNYIIKNVLQSPNRRNFYLNCYNKILNYKAYIKGLIRESILYSLFGFFLIDGFTDARGRYYLEGYYLNIQNFPICKAFVKFYNPDPMFYRKDNFKIFKKEFVKIFTDKTVQEKIMQQPLYVYEIAHNKNVINYIFSFFNQDNKKLRDVFRQFLQESMIDPIDPDVQQRLIDAIRVLLKKKEEFYIVYSYILTESIIRGNTLSKFNKKYVKQYSHYTNVYGLDATTSGLQMTAILFRSKNLAEISNLTGGTTYKKNDIYQQFATNFHNNLTKARTLIDKYSVLCRSLPQIFSAISNDGEICTLVIETFKILGQTFRSLFPDNIEKTLEEFREHKWLLSINDSLMLDSIKTYTKYNWKVLDVQFSEIMLIFNSILLFTLELEQNPWKEASINRAAFKKAVLTFGYSSTPYGRREGFVDYLLEVAHETHMLWDITRKDVFNFASILEQFFDYTKDSLLGDCTKLLKISEILAKNSKPIRLITQHFNMTFAPYKTKKDIVNTLDVLTGKRKHQLTIRIDTGEIDTSKFSSTFGPNFVHAMDATIVHLFRSRVLQLSKLLAKHHFYINQFTNHDTFCLTAYPFLRLLVRDCYIELYNMNFLQLLLQYNDDKIIEPHIKDMILKFIYDKNDTNNFFDGTFDNDHFIGF